MIRLRPAQKDGLKIAKQRRNLTLEEDVVVEKENMDLEKALLSACQ
jgi:hypothetical protein